MKRKLQDLSIDNIVAKDQYDHPEVYHPNLPQHAFSMLIIAPKGSGKTNFLCNLILKYYKGYFHRVMVCSPTIHNDEKWEVVKKTKGVLAENKKLMKTLEGLVKNKKIKKVVFQSGKSLQEQLEEAEEKFDGIVPEEDFFADLDEIPARIAEQNKLIKKLQKIEGVGTKAKYLADRQLVILDDQAGMFKGGNTNNPMVQFVIKHRHTSTSVIIVTQGYKAVPKTIRTNCNAQVIFDIANKSELQAIYEENPVNLDINEWTRVYEHATKEDYAFMYINTKFSKGKRIFKNLDTLLTVGDAPSDDQEEPANNKRKADASAEIANKKRKE